MPNITWTFDDGTSEGWRYSNANGATQPTDQSPPLASSGDALQGNDGSSNTPWFFTPADLAGDQSNLYGGVFSYNWTDTGSGRVQRPNLLIGGQDGSRIYILQDVPPGTPTGAGTSSAEFSVTLQVPPVEAGTTIQFAPPGSNTFRTATEADLRNILSQFNHFSIAGDLRFGSDTFRLEDVSITAVCFVAGTLIETISGNVPVELLQAGDLVKTLDHGYQPLRWTGSRKLSADDLEATPKLLPIRICAGALGPDMPASDSLVSPQHRILVRSAIAQRMFGASEVLVPAKHITEISGIEVADDLKEVQYFHLLFDRHEVIYSNGAETESLFTGEQALKSIEPAAREEIYALFPEILDANKIQESARPLVPNKLARKMALRHFKNHKQLAG